MAGVDGVDESQETVRSRAQGQSTPAGAGGDALPSSQSLPASLNLPWDIWRMGPGGRGALRARVSVGIWEGLSWR